MTWTHAIMQAWLIIKHPFKLAFQDHYYYCKRCGLGSAVEYDLCVPEKVEWTGNKK